jgi:hypothetical protein
MKRGRQATVWNKKTIQELWNNENLTIGNLARILGRTYISVYKSVQGGYINHIKGTNLVTRQEALKYMETCRRQGNFVFPKKSL